MNSLYFLLGERGEGGGVGEESREGGGQVVASRLAYKQVVTRERRESWETKARTACSYLTALYREILISRPSIGHLTPGKQLLIRRKIRNKIVWKLFGAQLVNTER